MTEEMARFTISISKISKAKMEHIAVSNIRTLNGEIRVAINNHIEEYEKVHGEIDVSKKPAEP